MKLTAQFLFISPGETRILPLGSRFSVDVFGYDGRWKQLKSCLTEEEAQQFLIGYVFHDKRPVPESCEE